MTIQELEALFKERYTPEYVRHLADEGNPTLAALPRVEDWAGQYYMAGGHQLTLVMDYERVIFSDMPDAMYMGCDDAIRAIGKRLELALKQGQRATRKRGGKDTWVGVDGLGRWEGRPVTLYSLGPAPHAFNVDGMHVLHAEPNAFFARFGYFANTGPTE